MKKKSLGPLKRRKGKSIPEKEKPNRIAEYMHTIINQQKKDKMKGTLRTLWAPHTTFFKNKIMLLLAAGKINAQLVNWGAISTAKEHLTNY